MTQAERDFEMAERLKPQLVEVLEMIARATRRIKEYVSHFNSPGLKKAFIMAIKNGCINQDFYLGTAVETLNEYYETREKPEVANEPV